MTTTSTATSFALRHGRFGLGRIRSSIGRLDEEIAAWKRHLTAVKPTEREGAEKKLSELESRREAEAAREADAAAKYGASEKAHTDFVASTEAEFTKLAGNADKAARRFDAAKAELAAAMDELDALAQPLAGVGFGGGLKRAVRRREIENGFQDAFADRLGKTMADRVAQLFASARAMRATERTREPA